ncbi:MAG: orotidine-5'-phosphate decarboxylase [Peptococcaceae bacterium]|nr:orotidine-5'-phosphate decarboxylase [Peptococcaceae bacterium]
MEARKKLLIALDVDSWEQASALVDLLKDDVGGFKIGMRLFYREGPNVVRRVAKQTETVFLDLKVHDIPQTASEAVRALIRYGANLINVHASGGRAMMEAVADAAAAEAAHLGVTRPRIIAVTVLTSLDDDALQNQLGISSTVAETVIRLARNTKQAGLDGVVASPREAAAIRDALGNDFLIVTPGIRPTGTQSNDQKRIMTPGDAVRQGADYLVVGRPVTGAPDPRQQARAIVDEITEALK